MFVVIGAGGFLGSDIICSVTEKTDEAILAVARNERICGAQRNTVEPLLGDLEDCSFLDRLIGRINESDNVKIIWTAACHNIDFVAEKPEKARNMNIDVPAYVLSRVKNAKKIFFTSSDTVYGEGGMHRFTENDNTEPISIYGRQKAEAEKLFASYGGASLRLPLMFSASRAPAKKHFCDTVCENLKNGMTTFLTTGFLRSALDYGTVADIIVELSYKEKLPDVINVAGDDCLSKYQLGLMLARKLGADEKLIIPVEKWGSFREGAGRTASTLLDNTLVKHLTGREEIKIKL